MVICLERDAHLHMAQLMPLPLNVSCFSKIQIGFTFLVPAHLGSLGQRAVKRVCVCVCVCYASTFVSCTDFGIFLLSVIAPYIKQFSGAVYNFCSSAVFSAGIPGVFRA